MCLNLENEIVKLKKDKDALILAHLYQPKEIQQIADYVGDSYYLSEIGKKSDKQLLVVCGVTFMAESAKILSPEKKVLYSSQTATCPMADMVTKEDILKLKQDYPNSKVVCYVNSSSEVKSVSDVCCTSSSAINIVSNIKEKDIIFVPDKNLGSYVANKLPEKNIILWSGYCPIHNNITLNDLDTFKLEMKDKPYKILVHPECKKEVCDKASFVGSTKEIIDFVGSDSSENYLVVTECGVKYDLEMKYPNRNFYFLDMTCSNMKKTSLKSLYNTLKNLDNEVILSEDVIAGASASLKNMLSLGI
ncbi:quinolinate synthase NadA [Clostridium ihumii]|uniref:quinolinate synthase NadA n=1 Tax=Clostridium ihumii TaxID=1470356 RepID=UPI00054D4FC5|nr:quinolinate synthase NadA [Clostridium ihumii]